MTPSFRTAFAGEGARATTGAGGARDASGL